MSDFMMSQVQGLLSKVADDVESMGKTTAAQTDVLLGAIDDLAANVFATQAIICVLVRKYPVDAAEAKAWISAQVGAGKAAKALDFVDMLLGMDAKSK
jgi:hypothetical protein